MSNYFRASLWLFVVSLMGLYQVMATIIDRFTDGIAVEIVSLVLDGYFLFFSITLLSLFMTDQIVSVKKDIKLEHPQFDGFIVFPFILIIISLLIHHTCKSKTLNKDAIDIICCIHYAIYTCTFIIALSYKAQQIKKKF